MSTDHNFKLTNGFGGSLSIRKAKKGGKKKSDREREREGGGGGGERENERKRDRQTDKVKHEAYLETQTYWNGHIRARERERMNERFFY